jgi:ankyrin repeat protein
MTIKSNIFKLVKKNDYKQIYKLIDNTKSFNVNIFNNNNISLLEICIQANQIQLIKLLLSRNIRFDILNSNNLSILDHIIRFNKIDIMKLFLEFNLNSIGSDILSVKGKFDIYPIHLAVLSMKLDMLKLIIKYSNDISYKNHRGDNIMHMASSSKKYSQILKYLIKNHPQLYTFNKNDESPIHLAIIQNFPKNIIQLLVDNFDINLISGKKNIVPMFTAIIENNESIYSMIDKLNINLDIQDYTGNNIFTYCIQNENYRYFDKFFNKINESKFNFNLVNIFGQTTLHSILDNLPFLKYCIQNKKLSFFIKNTNLNLQDNHGNSIFLLLCKFDLWESYYSVLESKPINAFLKNNKLQKPIQFIKNNQLNEFYNLLRSSFFFFIKNNSQYQIDKNILIKCSKINDKCKHFIYNYIKMKSISVLPKKISYCHNIIDNNTSYVTFIGLQLDIFFGLFYLFKKNKKILTTLKLNVFSDNKLLIEFYNNNGIDKDFQYDIPNLEIKWTFQKLILPENFFTLFTKKNKKSIIIVPIAIILQEGSHSNILIFDIKKNIVIRFEPYGSKYPFNFNYNPNLLDLKLEEAFSKIQQKFNFIPPKLYLQKLSFQAFEISEDQINKKIGDPGGFCAAWSLWFAENYINNSNKIDNLSEFIDDLILQIRIKNISFKNMIRSFSAKIATFRDKYLKKINIDINQWNNGTLDIKTYDKAITYLESLI